MNTVQVELPRATVLKMYKTYKSSYKEKSKRLEEMLKHNKKKNVEFPFITDFLEEEVEELKLYIDSLEKALGL